MMRLSLCFLLLVASPGARAINPCQAAFRYLEARREDWKRFKQYSISYWKEVADSPRYRRFFLKKPSEAESPHHLALRFLTEYEPSPSFLSKAARFLNPLEVPVQMPMRWATKRFGKKYTLGLPHEITPFKGLYHLLIRTPVTKATKRFSKDGPFELTHPMDLLVVSLAGYASEKAMDYLFREKECAELADLYGEQYDQLIEEDPRFQEIRYYLVHAGFNGKPYSRHEGRLAACNLLKGFNKYVEYMANDLKKDPLEAQRATRLQFMARLAPHIVRLIDKGVQPAESYYHAPPESLGPLSLQQIDGLLDVEDAYFALCGRRDFLIRNALLLNQQELADDGAFVSDLVSLFQEGEISLSQFQRALWEEAQWRERFAICDILKVSPITAQKTPDSLLAHQEQIIEKIAAENSGR